MDLEDFTVKFHFNIQNCDWFNFSVFFLLAEMPVFSEMVAYDYPKHSKEDAGAKLILMPETMLKNWNLRVSGWTLGWKKPKPH